MEGDPMSRRPARFTQADVARAIKGARMAGIEVRSVEIARDGRISIKAGSPPVAEGDDLDRELADWEARHCGQG